MPEFLFEASHINEVTVCIKGCTQSTVGVVVHCHFVIDLSTYPQKKKEAKKKTLLLLFVI